MKKNKGERRGKEGKEDTKKRRRKKKKGNYSGWKKKNIKEDTDERCRQLVDQGCMCQLLFLDNTAQTVVQ